MLFMKNKEKADGHDNLRKSNFELLRLVAMFFIICHHLVIRSAQTCGYTHPFDINEDLLGGGDNQQLNCMWREFVFVD